MIDSKKFPSVKIIAPENIPMISEKYTSFVKSANTIVIIGGSSEIADASKWKSPFVEKVTGDRDLKLFPKYCFLFSN